MNDGWLLQTLYSTGKYLAVVGPSMYAGVVLANLLINLGLLEKISWVARPVTRLGNLSEPCGLSFVTAFGSPAAANAMLVDWYRKGDLNKKELYVAALANSFPAILMHWRSMIPVLIALLGIWGVGYFAILVAVGFVKTSLILVFGRLILPVPEKWADPCSKNERSRFGDALKNSFRQAGCMIKRLLLITVPVTLCIFALMELGIFEKLTHYLRGLTQYLPIPAESLAVVAAKFGNHVAAYTISSNLLSEGILTGRQVILVLLISDVLASITGLRYLIPYYMGIYGPRMGAELLFISTFMRQSLIVIAVLIFFLI